MSFSALPAMALMLLFIAAPLANAIRISFFRWNGYSQTMRWNGLETISICSRTIVSEIGVEYSDLRLRLHAAAECQRTCGRPVPEQEVQGQECGASDSVHAHHDLRIHQGQILYFFIQADGGVFNEILTALGLSDVYWMETGLSSTIVITLANSGSTWDSVC